MFDFITGLVGRGGYLGIAFLMFLENIFPPIPSELIMPLAGFQAAQGRLNMVGVVLAGSFGSLCGATFWYYVGKVIGTDRLKGWARRHGRWVALTARDVDRVDKWFDRHCGKTVLVGRMVPTLRTLISVPAGLFGMSLPRFLIYSSIGTALWTGFLAGAGYLLEAQYKNVGAYFNPIANLVVAAIAGVYLFRVITWNIGDRGEHK